MKWWRSSKQELATHAIEWDVRRALLNDLRLRDFDHLRIRIRVGGAGDLELAGAVSTAEARDLAEQVARSVDGVATVRNELRTDDDLTAQLRDMLSSDPHTRGLARDAVIFQGRAELRGSATADAERTAMGMAGSIDGVRSVANYLQVSAPARASDVRGAA